MPKRGDASGASRGRGKRHLATVRKPYKHKKGKEMRRGEILRRKVRLRMTDEN